MLERDRSALTGESVVRGFSLERKRHWQTPGEQFQLLVSQSLLTDLFINGDPEAGQKS